MAFSDNSTNLKMAKVVEFFYLYISVIIYIFHNYLIKIKIKLLIFSFNIMIIFSLYSLGSSMEHSQYMDLVLMEDVTMKLSHTAFVLLRTLEMARKAS